MSKSSALALLVDYGGESSDEEVPGPRVSTKRPHKNEDLPSPKRLEKLPVPRFVQNDSELDYVEDPNLHDGRLRSFPHERGNWATYIYIPFELNEDVERVINSVIARTRDEVELKVVTDFHVSLTRTVILKYHWIHSFIETIKENIGYFHKFVIMFNSLNVYCNDERSRTFIGLQIRTGYDSLSNLIDRLNSSLKDFNLPTFYKDPSFHMSILWCLGDYEEKLKALLPDLKEILQNIIIESPQEHWYIYVENILCKTGNKYFQFHLV